MSFFSTSNLGEWVESMEECPHGHLANECTFKGWIGWKNLPKETERSKGTLGKSDTVGAQAKKKKWILSRRESHWCQISLSCQAIWRLSIQPLVGNKKVYSHLRKIELVGM